MVTSRVAVAVTIGSGSVKHFDLNQDFSYKHKVHAVVYLQMCSELNIFGTLNVTCVRVRVYSKIRVTMHVINLFQLSFAYTVFSL